jgi:Dockerin type I domain
MKIHTISRTIIYLVSLSLAGVASAQLVPTRPVSAEEPERYDNPPAAPRKMETSPRMISRVATFVSYQANVDANGNNILGDAANEPSIAVDPTNPNKIAIAWRQFNSVASNFRQGGWGYSSDGGLTWHFPGVLQNNVFRSDPVMNSDETGVFFYLSLQSDQNEDFFCDDVWGSMNGGQTWTERSPDRGAHGGDKEWFTVDRTSGSGHGFQYQFWTGFFACDSGAFSRSTNGGFTWQTPISIPNSMQTGTLDVASNGNLFVGGTNGGFYCSRSSNAQNGGVTPTFDQTTSVNLGGSLVQGGINGVGLCGQTFLVVDRSGGPTNNNIYMLASVEPNGASNGTDVMFARSTNGGASFSAPHRINDDPINQNKWHWLGTISVAPNGRIDVEWLDTRNAANNTDSQLFYSYSTDGGVTWAANVQVSNSFNPFEGYPNQSKIGDYITSVSDNTGASVAYPATFNFNPSSGQHEEDVYYVRVFPAVPTVTSAVSRKTHGAAGNFDVNLPLTGTPGIECRSTGGTNDYTMVVTFAANVTVTGSPQAQVTLGTGCVGSAGTCTGNVSVSGAVVTVPLTNMANAQTINVQINGVNNAAATDAPATNFTIPMSILIGDTNANATVNAADVAQTKAQLGQIVGAANFRTDINANGTINAADTAIVKQHSGTSLPPQ